MAPEEFDGLAVDKVDFPLLCALKGGDIALRYLFRPRSASWSIRVSYCASGPSFLPSTEVSGALIVNAT
jgi:hypothetical protein